MTHSKAQHGGWAAQAKRRGEEYKLCISPGCGQRAHPRQRYQAAPEPPVEEWPLWKTAAVVIGGIALIVALGLLAGVGYQVPA